ncbi:MAG: hypothetical protein LBG48_04330 [Rickettsiales bacterium]|jgi:myo-inositol-1(or 4)-monophosphatase|nr:hypothetical protein [Rickettsiales bacterium]
MQNNDDFIQIIFSFLKKAGKIALLSQNSLTADKKEDDTIVTGADMTISRLFQKTIGKFLDTEEHNLLDEENLPDINNFFSKKTRFLWTLDPIDGTTTYYHKLPLWAIGVSLYKDFKPYIGAIYVPTSKELTYTDGKKSYYVSDVFTRNEIRSEIRLQKKSLTKQSVILQHKSSINEEKKLAYTVLDLYSSYIMGFYTLTGRSSAVFFNKPMKLWDITATLPIARSLGLRFTDLESGKEVECLTENLINKKWLLNSTYLMCQDHNFGEISELWKAREEK